MNAKISALAEWFTPNAAEKAVRGYSAAQLASIKELVQAAAARVELADERTEAVFAPAAVTLHREAIRLLGNATLIASGRLPPAGPTLGLPEVSAELEAAVATGQLPRRYAEARAILDAREHLTFAGRDGIERTRAQRRRDGDGRGRTGTSRPATCARSGSRARRDWQRASAGWPSSCG